MLDQITKIKTSIDELVIISNTINYRLTILTSKFLWDLTDDEKIEISILSNFIKKQIYSKIYKIQPPKNPCISLNYHELVILNNLAFTYSGESKVLQRLYFELDQKKAMY